MTPEREQELARDFGLDEVPVPRYDDVPAGNRPSSTAGLITFKKSILLVDYLRTAAFHRYLHDSCHVNLAMDARVWSPEHSFSIMVRTDVPPPVNERITRATGIHHTMDDRDYFIWLAAVVAEQWTILGAKSMAAPLIYASGAHAMRFTKKLWAEGARPFMGVITKYEFTPGVYGAEYGVIVPTEQRDSIKESHRVVLDLSK